MTDATENVIAAAQRHVNEATLAVAEPIADEFQHRLSQYARLELLRRDLEDSLKSVKAEAAKVSEPLLEEFIASGIQNANAHGLTIFIRRDLVVNKLAAKDGVTTDMICESLRALGREDMIGEDYNASSLKAYVREFLDSGDDPQAPLDDVRDGETVVREGRLRLVPESLRRLLYVAETPKLATQK